MLKKFLTQKMIFLEKTYLKLFRIFFRKILSHFILYLNKLFTPTITSLPSLPMNLQKKVIISKIFLLLIFPSFTRTLRLKQQRFYALKTD